MIHNINTDGCGVIDGAAVGWDKRPSLRVLQSRSAHHTHHRLTSALLAHRVCRAAHVDPAILRRLLMQSRCCVFEINRVTATAQSERTDRIRSLPSPSPPSSLRLSSPCDEHERRTRRRSSRRRLSAAVAAQPTRARFSGGRGCSRRARSRRFGGVGTRAGTSQKKGGQNTQMTATQPGIFKPHRGAAHATD